MRIGIVQKLPPVMEVQHSPTFRLAATSRDAGHVPVIVCGSDWPNATCPYEHVVVQAGKTSQGFADRLAERRETAGWDVLYSAERVWACDVFLASEGVHAARLDARSRFEPAWRGWFRGMQREHREIVELECKLFTGGARRVIASSNKVMEEIVSHYGTAPEHIHVIHGGMDAEAAQPGIREQVREEMKLSPSDFVILFESGDWANDGLRDALLAVRALEAPATLLVAGRGEATRAMASERVRLLGPASPEYFRRLLAAADVFVLPTLYDPYSRRCLDALAAAVPVITTSANGISEIMQSGVNGEIVPPRNPRALANALVKWSDPARRSAARPEAAEAAARHPAQDYHSKTLEVIVAAHSGR